MTRRSFLGASLLAVPAVAGCGALMPAGSGPNDLVVHTQLSGAVAGAKTFQQVVAAYRESRGAQVALLSNGSDLPIVFETSVLAGKEADIAIVNMMGKTLAWTKEHATVPVTGYVAEWDLDGRILPDAVTEWTDENGALRAFPYTRTNWPVAFNTRLLAEAGVAIPTTSNELIAAADALRSHGIGPVTVGGSDWSGQKLFLQVIQGFLTPAEARQVFSTGKLSASENAMRGVAHFVELRDAGVFVDNAQGFTSDSMLTQFKAGQCAIASIMSSALALIPAARAAEVAIGGWPVPPGGAHSLPTVIRSFNGHGIWVSENGAKKLDLVKPFVEYLFSPEVISKFVLESGRDMNAVTDTVSRGFPLVAATQSLRADQVSPVMLPDLLIPDSVFEPLIQATAQAYGAGISAERIVALFESAYTSA